MTWKHCSGCGFVTKHDRSGCTHEDHGRAPARSEGAVTDLFAPSGPPSNGTRTSDAAAASLTPEMLNDGQRTVLNALWKYRHCGLTDEEIQRVTNLNPSTERPRRGELVEGGLVEDTGETRPTRSGRGAIIWNLSERARALGAKRTHEAA